MNINILLADSSNYTSGRTKSIEYIVIHYTANNGDTAKGNCNYFQSGNRNASANYFVDEMEIWQSVLDNNTAWHCGTNGKYYHNSCRNDNSIGIELCSRKDSKGNYYFKDETIIKAVELVKYLMKKYNIPIKNIIRHYDVTHKICPEPMVNNVNLWNNFLNLLEVEEVEKIQRSYKYGNSTKIFDVINLDGNNYIKVRDFADLVGKVVEYDDFTKITTLK